MKIKKGERTIKGKAILLSSLLLVTGFCPLGGISHEVTYAQAAVKTPEEVSIEVLKEVSETVGEENLPQHILNPDTKLFLSAATDVKDKNNYSILYFAEDKPIDVNNVALNDLKPIAQFKKTTYDTKEEAISKVNRIDDLNGKKVDLGYGTVGYMQGAAGTTGLIFNMGNWNILFKASNIKGESPLELGKAVVKYLNEVYLTEPSDKGQITLSVNGDEGKMINEVRWNVGKTLYEIRHVEPLYSVVMTGSLNEIKEE